VSAALASGTAPDAQHVAVNLVLHEDAALGGVVSALTGMHSQIRSLGKSEPTLEDVFVELVGRGLSEEADEPPMAPSAADEDVTAARAQAHDPETGG